MTEPAAAVNQTSSACPTKNCTNLSGTTNTSKSCVGSKAFVVTGTPNKKDSIQNLINGEVQGIENSHDKMNIHGKKKNSGRITMHDLYKIYKENAGQLSYQEYILGMRNACAHILGYQEINCLGSNGKEQESDSGHTADHASEQNAVRLT